MSVDDTVVKYPKKRHNLFKGEKIPWYMININPESYSSKNILSNAEVPLLIEKLKKEGKKIGLCTGGFDLLHPGHITHFISAKKICDILIVGIAKDCYSQNKYDNSGRPIFSQGLRAFMVSKLKPVDYVIFDDCDEEASILYLVKPDVYIKGSDYADEKNAGIIYYKKSIESWGGKIHFTSDEKFSTSELIKYIKEKVK